jgi:hypothetical protein
MSQDLAMQLFSLCVTAMTTLWGYRSVASKLSGYITVDQYRTKVSELHSEINNLKVRVAVLEVHK